MKKFCITFFIIAIIVLSAVGVNQKNSEPQKEYLRIHIRANSNDDIDQSVKYLVKNAVIEYLTPKIADCDTKKKAETLLCNNLDGITVVANAVLKEKGFTYGANASVRREVFPTRKYGDLTLDGGEYDALILELGSGKGDNWWCVVYPPLCFTGEGQEYEYKSKIKEIIDNFFNE